jgi:hypothetical protein
MNQQCRAHCEGQSIVLGSKQHVAGRVMLPLPLQYLFVHAILETRSISRPTMM